MWPQSLVRKFFWFGLIPCVALLGWCGGAAAEEPYIVLSQLASADYFAHFLIVLPLLSYQEAPEPLPHSIHCLCWQRGFERGRLILACPCMAEKAKGLYPKTRSDMIRVMAQITASVEYALHCLLWLVSADSEPASSRELAELQGISPSFVAKIFPKLEKAGIVRASEGVAGGYALAREPSEISVLQVVDAIEGDKPLFECREIRGGCALFGDVPPDWATRGTCSIHAVMLRAEKAMRAELAASSLNDVARAVASKAPVGFGGDVQSWLGARSGARASARKGREVISS